MFAVTPKSNFAFIRELIEQIRLLDPDEEAISVEDPKESDSDAYSASDGSIH